METVILVLAPPSPSPSRADNNNDDDELRRREFAQEQVLTDHDISRPSSTPVKAAGSDKVAGTTPASPFSASRYGSAAVPACFTSYDACMSGTSNCSGHGDCVAKWGGSSSSSSTRDDRKERREDGSPSSCYACRCLHTTEKDARGRESLYRWGGGACQKIDISTPFWLFAAVTLALVGTVAFAIGLLFSVGEEKLPGVIGAGVSRGGSK